MHNLQDPAQDVNIVPGMKNTLISASKFANAKYVTVFTKDKVKIYDANTTEIKISEEASLSGWRDWESGGLYCIPHLPLVSNKNTVTTLLTSEDQTKLLAQCRPETAQAIYTVYELPSTKKAIRYLHTAAGFPTKATWLKAIRAGHYASWPVLNVHTSKKYFPQSDETQKGHMIQTKEGV